MFEIVFLPLKNGFIRKVILRRLATDMASGSSTALEHSPHHPIVEGLSPATAVDTGWQKMAKNYMNFPRIRIYGATTFSIMILTITTLTILTLSLKGY
jgi:hypothetical protein